MQTMQKTAGKTARKEVGQYLGTLFYEHSDGVDHDANFNIYEWKGHWCDEHGQYEDPTYGTLSESEPKLCFEEQIKVGIIMYLPEEADAGNYCIE